MRHCVLTVIIVLLSDDKTFDSCFIFIVTSLFVSRLGVTHVEDCAISRLVYWARQFRSVREWKLAGQHHYRGESVSGPH